MTISMKYCRLPEREQRLLSNKKLLLFLLFTFILFNCGEKEKKHTPPADESLDPAVLMKAAKTVYGKNVQSILTGNYTDTTIQCAVMTETITPEVWGINFNLMKKNGSVYEPVFNTDILQGSFKESELKNMRLPGFDFDLVYYNSLDYFMGSGGGEIFSYIIDFKNRQTYYAHLVADTGKPVSLYLSDNSGSESIKDFFVNTFRNDYPALVLIDEDVELE